MSQYYAAPVARLIEELQRLPGIGPKSAQRLAFFFLKSEESDVARLADALTQAKQSIHFCSRCFNFASDDLCDICSNTERDQSIICVVEEPKDIVAFERTGEYRAQYHVLQGAISPIDGIGPEQLRVRELLARLGDGVVKEVVVATNPTVEGETTALYLARLVKPLGVRVTRIASGLPVGGDIEYADEVTLGRALEARRDM
jgi:recombination protein RecR